MSSPTHLTWDLHIWASAHAVTHVTCNLMYMLHKYKKALFLVHLAEKLPKQVLLDAYLHKMHHIWSIGSHKCDYKCCHQVPEFTSKMRQISISTGLCPRPRRRTYSASWTTWLVGRAGFPSPRTAPHLGPLDLDIHSFFAFALAKLERSVESPLGLGLGFGFDFRFFWTVLFWTVALMQHYSYA